MSQAGPDILDDLRFWSDAAYPTESIGDGHLKEMCKNAAEQIERLQAGHQEIVRKYEKMMGEPPTWTNFKGDQLKWVREAWYGAAKISRKALGGDT